MGDRNKGVGKSMALLLTQVLRAKLRVLMLVLRENVWVWVWAWVSNVVTSEVTLTPQCG